jgi:cation diffusion facilitator CzcD-associated flavoprotein CzcO
MYRFSGLGSAIQLKKQLNVDADLFEITKDIGGTWNYNTYPGGK